MSIQNIIKSIENTYGQPITRAKDCDLLAEDIERVTGRPISSATLRRLFGLLKSKSKLSPYNQETLQRYVDGISDLEDQFNDWASPDEDTVASLIDILLEKFNQPNGELAEYLMNLKIPSHVFFEVLQTLILQSVEGSFDEFILKIYNRPHLVLENPKVFRTLGYALRNHADGKAGLLDELAKSSVARRQFFERFVDMGNFKTYQNWLQVYLAHESEIPAHFWAKSLLMYGKYLSKKQFDFSEILEFIGSKEAGFEKMHSYTAARILGLGLLIKTKPASDLIHNRLRSEQKNLKKNPHNPPLFSVMLLQYLFLSGDLGLAGESYRNLNTYQPTRTSHIDFGVPFLLKILGYFVGKDTSYTLDEVKYFNSGHTNDDVVLKYYASKYAIDGFGRILDYQRELIATSGFVRLKGIFR